MTRTPFALRSFLAAVALVVAAALPAMAQTPKDPSPAAAELAALRAETKAIRAQLKDARAAQQLEKARAARDKARADLAKLTAGGAK